MGNSKVKRAKTLPIKNGKRPEPEPEPEPEPKPEPEPEPKPKPEPEPKYSERAASFQLEDLFQQLQNNTDKSPEFKFDPDRCCIYRVPLTIRRVNEEVYTQLISIGPLHHGKQELANMENKKEQYVNSFLQRTTIEKIEKIISFIKDNENNIRTCYAEVSTLRSDSFVKMILFDSIFIIEIFLRDKKRDIRDILLETMPIRFTLWTDLQLFENQLPYFILDKIYTLVSDATSVTTFTELSIDFFGNFMGTRLGSSKLEVKHFTDWMRIGLLKDFPPEGLEKGVVRDLPCAVKLHESGLKFVTIETERSILDITFEKPKRLISFFEVNELQIPQLKLRDETEPLLRNIMALEQCLYPEDAHVCNYITLMDYLINTAEDVDLLSGNGIISNYMGDNATVATMFNKLNQNIATGESSYHNLCKQLKEHYRNPWNRARATLKRVYFNNPWRGTATVAAIILLFLTIAQTVFSILQVV